jgi:hypothetical protein
LESFILMKNINFSRCTRKNFERNSNSLPKKILQH